MNIIVRTAHPEDAAIIAGFNAAMALETEQIALDRDILRKGVEALLADPSKGFYYLAERDGKIAGQLMITYEWSDWRNADFWWIQSVYVLPEFRGQGIFRSLYTFIEALARSSGNVCGLRLYVEKGNDRARGTYESLGMHGSHYEMMEVLLSS